ncbi:type II toxin-antitoxin system RelE/ParE family toxin [Methylomonas sp. LL1]|uniref:type II toxin-antitoxin system RelE/ParE family toxin n=1 Tax=Methylomonas sp. LL1 TaxID=2785785 RepID=UPI0018C40015|nr:type II toxin-antitoxin system RelE/ParE family toxin [Methylomonas sp. LL1]QPK65239.1 type II toxin-antitoxin system RelE/ParE family toxin [Methylomonas sp. LL1]
MKVEFLEAAQAELDQAFEWYETQQTNLDRQFITEFEATIRRIIRYPLAYISIDQQLRRCLIKRFPYAILYGIDADTLGIVAIAHCHRKPDYWLKRIAS